MPLAHRPVSPSAAPHNDAQPAAVAGGPAHLRRIGGAPRRLAEMIDSTAWAADLDFPSVEKLAAYFEAWEASPGEVVFEQGDRDPYLCLLVSGEVRIVKDDSSEAPKTLARVSPGRTFGEMSLLDGEPRSAAVVVERSTSLLTLSRARLDALLEQNPRLGAVVLTKLAKLMSQRLRLTSGILVDYLEG